MLEQVLKNNDKYGNMEKVRNNSNKYRNSKDKYGKSLEKVYLRMDDNLARVLLRVSLVRVLYQQKAARVVANTLARAYVAYRIDGGQGRSLASNHSAVFASVSVSNGESVQMLVEAEAHPRLPRGSQAHAWLTFLALSQR